MSILIFAVIVVVMLVIAVYGIRAAPLPSPFGSLLIVLACVIAIVAIGVRAGVV